MKVVDIKLFLKWRGIIKFKKRIMMTCIMVFSLIFIFWSCGISSSHIDGNVPDKKEFDKILEHDLESYFKDIIDKDKVTVDYELLRNGPTQSGTSYPKFYLWVSVNSEGTKIEEGAIRIAAIDKVRFEVTNYLSKEKIKSDAEVINSIFPKSVCEKIKEKIK